jgi:hypothetical protein
MASHFFKTQYMPVYLGNSYKLAALRVYPIGKDPFYIENLNPSTQKRFSNVDFLQFVEDQFFIKYGYKGV